MLKFHKIILVQVVSKDPLQMTSENVSDTLTYFRITVFKFHYYYKDLMIWSNERVVKWVQSIGLKEYANNLNQSGIHGGVLYLDENYDWQQLALALKIPMHDIVSRQALETEFNTLIVNNRQRNRQNVNF